jgi:hypothetical protein
LGKEVFEALEVAVVGAGTAVEEQHLDRGVAYFFGPDVVAVADVDHAGAAGEDFAAVREFKGGGGFGICG